MEEFCRKSFPLVLNSAKSCSACEYMDCTCCRAVSVRSWRSSVSERTMCCKPSRLLDSCHTQSGHSEYNGNEVNAQNKLSHNTNCTATLKTSYHTTQIAQLHWKQAITQHKLHSYTENKLSHNTNCTATLKTSYHTTQIAQLHWKQAVRQHKLHLHWKQAVRQHVTKLRLAV